MRLGINIDHIATIRNARGEAYPCPIQAAQIAMNAGADGITAHLREDRRHIKDTDIYRLKNEVALPLNFEMAATDEMVKIALDVKPNAVCFVPEKRAELTTEGGLNVRDNLLYLKEVTKILHAKNIRISLFIDADIEQIKAAKIVNADIIELHTGKFAETMRENKDWQKELNKKEPNKKEFNKIADASKFAMKVGLETHAGHGLDFISTKEICKIPELKELNIGHFIISQAIFSGLGNVIAKMKNIINE